MKLIKDKEPGWLFLKRIPAPFRFPLFIIFEFASPHSRSPAKMRMPQKGTGEGRRLHCDLPPFGSKIPCGLLHRHFHCGASYANHVKTGGHLDY